uniref:[histone H3]-lysine(4) N-trimethyltransferase n=1 Tax=Anas platyrhynchos platyrhynchos TaxID=8840 RepID=A0A493T9P6_ANAPP
MRFRLLFSFVPLLFQILFFALEYLKTVSYISKINTNRVLMFITDFLFCFFSNRNEHLHRCSQCKVAKYCGKSCQKEAWLDHKQECKCLKSIKPNFPPDSVRLAGRIVFKLLRQSVCISERLYSFSDLQSNTEQLSEEMKDGLRHLAHTLQLYLKAEIQDASHLPAAIDFFQIFTKTLLDLSVLTLPNNPSTRTFPGKRSHVFVLCDQADSANQSLTNTERGQGCTMQEKGLNSSF